MIDLNVTNFVTIGLISVVMIALVRFLLKATKAPAAIAAMV
jgi:hypothetical protein